jgi:integrase/recombinase XerD
MIRFSPTAIAASLTLVSAVFVAAYGGQPAQSAPPCDSECLSKAMADFLQVMTSGATGSVPLAELVSLRLDQFDSRSPPSIRVLGKGRRERVLPLWKETTAALKAWLKVRQANGAPELFHNAGARAMTRAGFEYILDKHASTASNKQPSIAKKRVTPHVLRHSCAMHILQATGDVRKVSLWLGHASMQSTEIYLRADPAEKLDALAMGTPPTLKRGKFQVPDKLMAMFKEVGRPV